MRIFDDISDKALLNVIIMLNLKEAIELQGAIEQLIEHENSKNQSAHFHVTDDAYDHEITVSIYNEKTIKEFAPRIQKLILDNE
jgi:hypothetical protein